MDRITVQPFNRTSGIYFEEIGLMNQIESVWKLVIKLIGAIEIRYQPLQDYVRSTEKRNGRLTRNVQQTCQNMKIMKIIQKDEIKLTLQLTHFRALYKTPSDRWANKRDRNDQQDCLAQWTPTMH